MKLCDTCGNELPDDAAVCPFCETAQSSESSDHAWHTPGGHDWYTGSENDFDKVDKHESDIPSGSGRQPPSGRHPESGHQQVMVVNLEAGMPIVRDALTVLDMKIREARQQGYQVIKVIHGWGSSGQGGRIKAALPSHLDQCRKQRIIKGYLPGEKYSNTTPRGRHLISKYPELDATIRSDRRNPGITIIEL